MDRTKRIILILFAASIAVGWTCFDERLSRLGDNAEFIVIAKSLATGHGMSFAHGPTPEPASKFPPGYPAILAVIQLISPDNINLMKSLSVFFFALVIPLTWLVIREIDTEIAATIVACSALLSPHLIEFSHQVLSEMPYAAISLTGILFLIKNRESEDRKKLLILVILAVASYYIRTVGLTMIGAVVCLQFLDRRFKHGLLMGTLAALMILPWLLSSSAYLDQFSSENPYRIETSATVSVSFLIDRVSQNLDKYGLMFFPKAFAPFMNFRPPHTWASNTLAVTVDLLILYFMVMTLRRSRREAPISVYLWLYFTVVLLWPEVWADTRFVIPIIPFAIYAILWSARHLLSLLPIPEQTAKWSAYAIGLIVLAGHGTESATTQVYHKPYHRAWRNYFESAEWIRDNTPGDALIVCRKPFLMNVISGRKTMSYPWIEPKSLLRELNRSGVNFVVSDVLFGTTRTWLNPAISQHRESFLPVKKFAESRTLVFEYLGYEEDDNTKKLLAKLEGINKSIADDQRNLDNWQKLYALGTMFHSANDLEQARQIYERVRPVLKKQSNVLLNLGILQFTQSKFVAAVTSFSEAVSQSPNDLEARLGLAQAYERSGDFTRASQQAKEVYKRNTKSKVALHIVARCAVALEKNEEAETAFRAALKLEPKSASIRNDLVFFYTTNNRYPEAYPILQSLIDDNPGQTVLRLNMVSVLTHVGETEAAKTYTSDLLEHHTAQIAQPSLRDLASRVFDELAQKLGISKESLLDLARNQ